MTPLMVAARFSQIETIATLLGLGADVSIASHDSSTAALTRTGMNALYVAALHGHVAAVRALADITLKRTREDSLDGSTLIHLALSRTQKGNTRSGHLLRSVAPQAPPVKAKLMSTLPISAGRQHMLAARSNHSAVVLTLADMRANMNFQSARCGSNTALHIATQMNSIAAAKVLLQSNADANIANSHFQTPLHIAALHGSHEIAELLVNATNTTVLARTNTNVTPTMFAAMCGHTDLVKLFACRGADIDAVDTKGNSALHFAATNGSLPTVVALVELGAMVNIANGEGITPCMNAATLVEVVRAVVDAASDASAVIDARNVMRVTPLMFSAIGGNVDVINLLVERGAEVNATTDDGSSALHFAAVRGNAAAHELLRRCAATIAETRVAKAQSSFFSLATSPKSSSREAAANNIANGEGITPCMNAATLVEVVRAVVDAASDASAVIDARNVMRVTPLMFSAIGGNVDVINLLVERGAEVNATTDDGSSALHFAAVRGNAAAHELLRRCGGDDRRNKSGKSSEQLLQPCDEPEKQ
ncbi:ankyrin repeat protein, putative [Bodo saltans]|uniref:Ankyrin repeat protein, putative n=1 Tax=Bodo saltans TaxID=75058 RepID=A0A0S4J4D0_BODSA|nr:ankyrin repeat protein, putative [Bodo saltans]|eukprot:CUG81333.1 ankyrin repeat protein, putative [Bodo saltans]